MEKKVPADTGKVGKGRPPKETRFGADRANPSNPGGRPKGESLTSALLKARLLPIAKLKELVKNPGPKVTAIQWQAARIALAEDAPTLKQAWDRTEGVVKEQLDVTSDGKAMQPSVVIYIPDDGRNPRTD